MYVWCIDGPLRGQKIWLEHAESGTLSFRLRGWGYGRYLPRAGSRDVYWHEKKDLQDSDEPL